MLLSVLVSDRSKHEQRVAVRNVASSPLYMTSHQNLACQGYNLSIGDRALMCLSRALRCLDLRESVGLTRAQVVETSKCAPSKCGSSDGDFFSSFLVALAECVEPLKAAESRPRCRSRFNATNPQRYCIPRRAKESE